MSAVDETVHELLMPRLSDTMTEGVLSKWFKSVGDVLVKGDPVAQVETDKVTVELEAPADGMLLALLVPEGGAVEPGGVVAVIGPEGATIGPEGAIDAASGRVPAPQPAAVVGATAAVMAAPRPQGGRRRVTPLARRLAAEHGIDLGTLEPGSGPDGRVLRQDVERAIDASSPRALERATRDDEILMLSQVQRAIARRMSAAKREIPHYYVDTTADMTRLLELRVEAEMSHAAVHAPLTAYLIRAVALALREFPRVNASWIDDTIVRRAEVNVGIAVAVAEEDLFVPVITDADRKTLQQIAANVADFTDRAREGSLVLGDMTDGTFTVSNLGSYGIETFHAIVNPPESGILAVGAIRRVPAFIEEQLVARDLMQISLSADHRVFSGATAAAFLSDVRRRLEQPLGLF